MSRRSPTYQFLLPAEAVPEPGGHIIEACLNGERITTVQQILEQQACADGLVFLRVRGRQEWQPAYGNVQAVGKPEVVKLRRVLLRPEVYELAEQQAQRRGQTVEALLTELVQQAEQTSSIAGMI